MKAAPTRLCIYPKDVMRITGKSERYCRSLLDKIKRHFNKAQHQFVTVSEFCRYTGLDEEQVQLFTLD